MSTEAQPAIQNRRAEWLLAILATISIGFAGWITQAVASIADFARDTAKQVAVNRENLDQLHTQVNRREDRDDAYTREAIRGLESRIEKLEDRARGWR